MKSFKALALAFVVVAGSAQAAYTGEKTVNNICKGVDKVCAKVSRPYTKWLISTLEKLNNAKHYKTAEVVDTVAGFPLDHHIIARTAFVLGVTAALYKTYKYFTKPAVEANKANTEVAQ